MEASEGPVRYPGPGGRLSRPLHHEPDFRGAGLTGFGIPKRRVDRTGEPRSPLQQSDDRNAFSDSTRVTRPDDRGVRSITSGPERMD